MKNKFPYILAIIGIALCITGIVITDNYIYSNGTYLPKEEEKNTYVIKMPSLYSTISERINVNDNSLIDKLDEFEKELSEALNFPNPDKMYDIKTIDGVDYYVLKSFSNTKGMLHQQTYRDLAASENRENMTNCLCYAYAYAQAMIYGSTNQLYAEVKRCDYPGSFGLVLEKNSKNIQVAYDEILNGRPSVIHGTGCGRAGQHYFDIVGITVESYEKYVTNGKVNSEFNNDNRQKIIDSLLVYDPWPNEVEAGFYNLGKDVPYYSYSCKWDIDNSIRHK